MDHATALRLQACERYVLGELNEVDRARFEEHFFSCPECAEDVKALVGFAEVAAPLLAAAGATGTRPLTVVRSRSWRSVRPLAAAAGVALLLGVASYQAAVTVPRLRRELAAAKLPQATTWQFLSVARGEPAVVRVAPGQRLAGITLSLGGQRPFPFYRVDVRAAGGRVVSSAVIAAPPAGDEIELLIPAALEEGPHAVVLSGLEERAGPVVAADLVRYPFTLVREERR